MRTAANASPSTSAKPKSTVAKVRLVSSLSVIVLSAPVGASATAATLMVTRAVVASPSASWIW